MPKERPWANGEVLPEDMSASDREAEFARLLRELSDDQLVAFLMVVLEIGTSRKADVREICETMIHSEPIEGDKHD